jgi:hypothetical protein
MVWGFVFVLAACGGDDSSSGNAFTNQGGNNVEAGADDASVPQGEGGPASCGAKSCQAGEFCCDGKCGLCAKVGTLCPPTTCP